MIYQQKQLIVKFFTKIRIFNSEEKTHHQLSYWFSKKLIKARTNLRIRSPSIILDEGKSNKDHLERFSGKFSVCLSVVGQCENSQL